MKRILLFLCLVGANNVLLAQYIYTINADSVKITNHCDTAELILENHTQNVPGFLFNKGRGRTEFRRVLQKLDPTTYLIGGDTLFTPTNAWVQGGNSFGTTGILGTLDNNHLDFYTNNMQRGRWTSYGDLLVGTAFDNGNKLQVLGYVMSGINITDIAGCYARLAGGSSYSEINLRSQTAGDLTLYGNCQPTDQTGYTGKTLYAQSNGIISGGYDNITDFHLASSKNMIFHIRGAEVARFTATGNMSIGSSADNGYKLLLYNPQGEGGLYAVAPSSGFANPMPGRLTNGVLTVASDNSDETYGHLVMAGYSNNAQRFCMGINTAGAPSYAYLGTTDISTGGALPIKFWADEYDFRSGNVGIGMSSGPTAQLHTTGTVRFAGLTPDTTETRVLVSDANGNLHYRNLSSWATNGVFNSSLAVKGTLSAEQVKIMPAGWADYVFSNTYRLPLLTDVENYIRQNNHLPGIPAAGEVAQKGIEVGENQAALLKKIEELTLYAIDQDKKTQQQAKEIDALKQEMAELKKLVKTGRNK